MPWFNDRPRRTSRHSSTAQKPTSLAPAVTQPTSPIEVKKSSTASNAQLRPSRRQGAAPISKRAPKNSPNKGTTTKKKLGAEIDVFAFMDNTDEGEDHHHTGDENEVALESTGPDTAASSPTSAHHPSSPYSDLEVNADQQSKRQTWHVPFDQAGSFHSDSGISMNSSGGGGNSPIQQHNYPSIRRASTQEPSIPEDRGLNVPYEPFAAQNPNPTAHPWPQLSLVPDDAPEAYYARATGEPPKAPEDTSYQLSVAPPELSPQLPRGRKQPPVKESPAMKQGYSELASRISSQEDAVLRPIYRKFETLNNRILLYMQDEISELETELEQLDATILQEEQCVGRGRHPASRRAEAKAPSPLQWHRRNLMDRCASKLDAYSRTLSSYSNLTQALSPSSRSDVKAYRRWIMKHNPIAKSEALFLSHDNDLVTISQNRQHSAPTSLKYSPVTVPITILMTIVAFKFVPQFLARLMMSAVMGLALMCMVSPSSLLDLQLLKDKKKGVGVYAAVMLMLAIVVD
ncbi:MAG: hypothetical protein Q9196_003811 [Gyalolechia fulgens]